MRAYVYILLALLTVSAVSAASYDVSQPWGPFQSVTGDFSGTMAIGEGATNVQAALEISLAVTGATGTPISPIAYTEYAGEPGIIITYGGVEEEFAEVFNSCGIDVDEYDRLAEFCKIGAKHYFIVYASDKDKIALLGRDIAGQKISGDIHTVKRAQAGAVSLNDMFAKLEQNQEEVVEEPIVEEEPVEEVVDTAPSEAEVILEEAEVVQKEEKNIVQKFFGWIGGWFR